MRVLLDTCTFLWIISDEESLSSTAVGIFRDPGNQMFLSSVSMWEIALKGSLGKLQLPEHPDRSIPMQRDRHEIQSLSLEEEAVLHLLKLPFLHRDPFDRMLICQAIEHELTILTPDSLILQYPVRTIW